MEKKFYLTDIKPLFAWDEDSGCFATDKITVEGYKVGYMVREEPYESDFPDSGWRFFMGLEEDGYLNDPDNMEIYDLNTICNYDPDIIPYLEADFGSAFIRVDEHTFAEDDGTVELDIELVKRK